MIKSVLSSVLEKDRQGKHMRKRSKHLMQMSVPAFSKLMNVSCIENTKTISKYGIVFDRPERPIEDRPSTKRNY